MGVSVVFLLCGYTWVRLVYRSACHSEWWCEEQFCFPSGVCWGGRLLVGFRCDDELQVLLPVWYSDISAPPVAYCSGLQSELAEKHGSTVTGEYSLGGLYCTWHDEGVFECMPWRELEIAGFKCVEADGDVLPGPVFASDLDWMVLSERFPGCD